MNKKGFESYLAGRYHDQIKWYSQKSSVNQKRYKIVNIYVITISALVPILISTLDVSQNLVKFAIAIISGTVAIVTGINNLFKFQENWTSYRTTAETLKKEKSFYQANAGEYGRTKNKENLFIERVESIISRENTLWLNVWKPQKCEKKD